MSPAEPSLSIQESLYPEIACFGCGHANAAGLRLRSYRDGNRTVAIFTPGPEHDNGFGFLNGGIIATVLDCHTGATVMWEADHRGWRAEKGAPLPFVTAGLEVKFLRPTPLGPSLHLSAVAKEISEAEIIVAAELVFDDKPRATVTARWLRFRPR